MDVVFVSAVFENLLADVRNNIVHILDLRDEDLGFFRQALQFLLIAGDLLLRLLDLFKVPFVPFLVDAHTSRQQPLLIIFFFFELTQAAFQVFNLILQTVLALRGEVLLDG